MRLEPGAPLGGRYRITRLLGEGGMGLVYAARDEQLGLDVAIKVLRDEVVSDHEAVTRFAREARAAATLTGPHVARILDVGEAEGGQPFMVMELLAGNDLGVELERRRRLPLHEAIDYVAQACEAIAEAHERGIIHRDLKPANLFLVVQGDGPRMVKVLDFGISRFEVGTEARMTQTQTAFGTPLYMSPEAMRSAKHTDARSDVWSFGVILYELLTGLTPFVGDTPTSVAISVTVDLPKPLSSQRPDVPPELEDVILRALHKDPARRFQTAAELGAALHRFVEAPPTSPPLREPDDAGLRSTSPAFATSQRPLALYAAAADPTSSGAALQEPRGRVALVLGVAAAALVVTVSVTLLLGWRSAPLADRSSAQHSDAPMASAAPARAAAPSRVEPQVALTPVAAESSVASSASSASSSASSPRPSREAAGAAPRPGALLKPPAPAPPPRPSTGQADQRPGGNPLLL